MYERHFCPILVFQKGTLAGQSYFLIPFWIEGCTHKLIDKFKCYSFYALMHPFIDRQPVN